MFKLWPKSETQSARLVSFYPLNTGFSNETKKTLVKSETYQLAMESLPESEINHLQALNQPDTTNTHQLYRNVNSMYEKASRDIGDKQIDTVKNKETRPPGRPASKSRT